MAISASFLFHQDEVAIVSKRFSLLAYLRSPQQCFDPPKQGSA